MYMYLCIYVEYLTINTAQMVSLLLIYDQSVVEAAASALAEAAASALAEAAASALAEAAASALVEAVASRLGAEAASTRPWSPVWTPRLAGSS
jgi:hypothetical protein